VDHWNLICNQQIKLSVNGTQQTFYGLLGSNSSTVVINTPYNSTNYSVSSSFGNYGTLTVSSPIIIVNEQKWEYGGVPVG